MLVQPLKRFFSQYSKFQYQPRISPITEFNRLCEEYRWKKYDPEKEAARSEFNIAMKREFDSLYGSDEKDINNWYKLCHVLKVDPVPNTLKKCRAVVLKKHVNLVDLVHGSREKIPIFKTEKELSDYTHDTGKFFPKENAVDGGVLRALRRHILVPRERQSRQGQRSLDLGLATHTTTRAFHSRVPIPSRESGRDGGDAPVVLCPTLLVPYHVILATYIQVQLAQGSNIPLLCSNPLNLPNLVQAAAQGALPTTT